MDREDCHVVPEQVATADTATPTPASMHQTLLLNLQPIGGKYHHMQWWWCHLNKAPLLLHVMEPLTDELEKLMRCFTAEEVVPD